MNLFHLHVEKDRGTRSSAQTWLVVAESLLEAISVVPEGFSVKAVEVQLGTAGDPCLVVKSLAAPVLH